MKPFTQRAKSSVAVAPAPSVRQPPVAPAPYRPQSTPIVLQRKTIGPMLKPPQTDRPRSMPPALQQQKTSALQPKTPPAAPPVYRPLPVPKVLQRKTSETHRPPVQPRAQSAHPSGLIQRSVPRPQAAGGAPTAVSGGRANAGGGVIQRAEQHQFVMGISERTDITPQSGFATIAKLTINGEDICHTKSGKLVSDCTSAHAEDVAVEVLKDKCWDAAAGRASPIVAGQLNEVWLYISSSPCTSDSRGGRPATSTKDIGCTEMII